MKKLPPALILLGSALLGYAGMAAYRHHAPIPPTTAEGSTLPGQLLRPAAASPAGTPPELHAAREETGPPLADRLRLIFQQFGISPEWAEALAADDAAAFPELLTKLRAMPKSDSDSAGQLEGFFFSRWAALDAAGAVAWLKSRQDQPGLTLLLKQWVLTDPAAALAVAGEDGGKLLRPTLNALAVSRPDAFFKWAAEHPEVNPLAFEKSAAAASWTALQSLLEADPDQVLEWTRRYPEADWMKGTPSLVAAALAKRSSDEALAWAKSIIDPQLARQAQVVVANVLADTQPEKALDLFSQIPDHGSEELMQDSLALFSKLGTITPDKLLATARAMPHGPVRDTFISGIFDDLLERNPTGAFALADSLGFEALPEMTYGAPREIRSAAQAKQVLDAALAGGTSVFRRHRATQAIGAWLETDQPALAAYLEGKMDTPFFAEMNLQEAIARTGRPLDPALAKVLGIRPEHEIAATVDDDPAAASAKVEHITDPSARAASIEKIAKAWGRQDQGDAIAWAATLTDPGDQAAAWKTIAGSWLKDDPQQASTWVNGLPPGAPRDATVGVLVDQVLARDPDLAWQNSDPAALREAIDAAAFPPAEKAALLQQLGNNPPR